MPGGSLNLISTNLPRPYTERYLNRDPFKAVHPRCIPELQLNLQRIRQKICILKCQNSYMFRLLKLDIIRRYMKVPIKAVLNKQITKRPRIFYEVP